MFWGLVARSGDIGYHLAKSLAGLWQDQLALDWELRRQLLAFNTTDMVEGRNAFLMLYDLLRDSLAGEVPVIDELARSLRATQA